MPRPGKRRPSVSRLEEIVGRHVERLQARADSPLLQENDAQERQEVINRCHPWECEESRQLQRLRRQYARDFQWSISQLKQCQAPRRRLEREIDTRGDQAEQMLERNVAFLHQAVGTMPPKPPASSGADKPQPSKSAAAPPPKPAPAPLPDLFAGLDERRPGTPIRNTPAPSPARPLSRKEKRGAGEEGEGGAGPGQARLGPAPRLKNGE